MITELVMLLALLALKMALKSALGWIAPFSFVVLLLFMYIGWRVMMGGDMFEESSKAAHHATRPVKHLIKKALGGCFKAMWAWLFGTPGQGRRRGRPGAVGRLWRWTGHRSSVWGAWSAARISRTPPAPLVWFCRLGIWLLMWAIILLLAYTLLVPGSWGIHLTPLIQGPASTPTP
jgi:hypothetical protein